MIIDSREQRALAFSPDDTFTGSRIESLAVGDYACEFVDGIRPPVVFERKSLSDLYGTMTSGYPRFKRELLRAKTLGLQVILIIEGSLATVLQGFNRSQFSGESCVKKLMTLAVKYDCYPVFCNSRAEMVRFITEVYAALGRLHVASVKSAPRRTPAPQTEVS